MPYTHRTLVRCSRLALACGLVLVAVGCAKPRPGERWVHDLKLRGAKSVKASTVLDGLATQETGWWPFASKKWLDVGALDKDLQRLRTYYARRGFFRAKAEHELVPRENKKSVNVVFTVEEGVATKVTAIELVGLETLPAQLARPQKLGIEVGERYEQGHYLAAKEELLRRLHQAGYAYAKVEGRVEIERDKAEAKIRLEVSIGPLVRLGTPVFVGLGSLPEDKLQRLIAWEKGDAYKPSLLYRTRAALFNQQVFSSVRLELPKAPTAESDVQVHVEPAKLHELSIGGGLGIERRRHELRLRGTWRLRNFLGGLRVLTLRVQPAFVSIPNLWASERTGFGAVNDLRIEQPDFLSTRMLAFGLVGYDLGVLEGYKWHGPRTQVGLDRGFFDGALRVGLSWNLQFLFFFAINEEAFAQALTPLLTDFVNPYRLAFFEPFIQLDLRDNALDPRAGLWAALRTEVGLRAVASDFDYFKLLPEVRAYVPLGTKRLVLAMRAQYGFIEPFSGTKSTPVTRRMSLGGPTSHRGFSFGRLSPQSKGVPLGGNVSLLFSGDLRWRVFKLGGNWLSLGAFFDAGDVVDKQTSLKLDNLHLATGGGLSYRTPIGAIRIALGVRLNRVDDPEPSPDPGSRFAFHLTIGEAF